MEIKLKTLKEIIVKDLIKQELSKKFYRYLKRNNYKIYKDSYEIRNYDLLKPNEQIIITYDDLYKKDYNKNELSLKIIYENNDFIIANKPPHLNSIPTIKDNYNSVYNQIRTYLENKNIFKSVHIITRLDKETSGLMIIAIGKENALYFNRDVSIDKYYYALVCGHIDKNEFVIDLPIKNDLKLKKRIISEDGKPSKTHVYKVNEYDNSTLLKLYLYTGRTHQIRVHLSYINHPIVGDPLYGTDGDRLYLHCSVLKFNFKGIEYYFEDFTDFDLKK